MSTRDDLVKRYVAVWNEPDAAARRRRIGELWAPDGRTSYSQLDSRGLAAIESRVASANEKWVREQGFVFRPGSAAGHHELVKLVWEMAPAAGGPVAARGLNVLVLGADGLIREDFQFAEPVTEPASPETEALVERYVAFWNEGDPARRRARLAELWAPDARFVSESARREGHAGIEAEAQATYEACGAKGMVFSATKQTAGHHDVVRTSWEMRPAGGGEVAASGFAVLVLAEDGRIRRDYQL
jgi:hypothetical protein